ncbi:MAG: accessory Sec system translocase SecA2 [bacterium]|nr:accessory Sec system translocase SecA2 [bacterium]
MNVISMESIGRVIDQLRGRAVEYDLREYDETVTAIAALESEMEALSDADLRRRGADLKARGQTGEGLASLREEVFACVREAARRRLGQRPFDEQIVAGIAISEARVAQMQTGEGKTLAAVAPAVLAAFTGNGVHILTVNDYLARRDAAWMGPIYDLLGLSVGVIQEGMSPAQRRQAYDCSITYATAKEVGFDLLRDHLCLTPDDLVHRPFSFAIADEADSILIDEARIPLVVAGDEFDASSRLENLAGLARELVAGEDFDTDEYARNINLTESGTLRVEHELACGHLFDEQNLELLAEMRNAIHAEYLLRRDVDYIVREGDVELVDELTGRVVEDRQWPNGLQAAIEAKEGLRLKPEGRILGSITLQHLMSLYPRLAGMTATAETAVEELVEFYDLDVVVVPTHAPCIRVDHDDEVFFDEQSKLEGLIEEILHVHLTRRPILVGTGSVAESEKLAEQLQREGVSCRVLNAKNDEQEADIVAEAGGLGAVTISTNMAGRGTDIRLGGRDERDREAVVDLGGLYVIGTNRHESRRIDDQLRGRAGRQGDPGDSRFFISLEDDLVCRFGLRENLPPGLDRKSLEHRSIAKRVAREIARTQRVVEGQNFDTRKTLEKYSEVIEGQRQYLQSWRQEILTGHTEPGVFAQQSTARFDALVPQVGRTVLDEIENRITLIVVDRCWSEYLAEIAEIRDGIHLVTLGGLTPINEFHTRAREAFNALLGRVNDQVVEVFEAVEITENGVDWEKEGLTGPSSTWTYLVTDQPFKTGPLAAMAGRQSVGAYLAVAYAPFLMAWMAFCRWRRSKGKPISG